MLCFERQTTHTQRERERRKKKRKLKGTTTKKRSIDVKKKRERVKSHAAKIIKYILYERIETIWMICVLY